MNDTGQKVQPYLFFDGRCEEAVEFYRKTLDAQVENMMRFKECPDKAGIPPGNEEKIMHCTIRIGNTQIMASDGHGKGHPKFEGFSLSLTAANEDECKRLFTALSEGGEVKMPLAKTFFSPLFGMVADRFGLGWMVILPMK